MLEKVDAAHHRGVDEFKWGPGSGILHGEDDQSAMSTPFRVKETRIPFPEQSNGTSRGRLTRGTSSPPNGKSSTISQKRWSPQAETSRYRSPERERGRESSRYRNTSPEKERSQVIRQHVLNWWMAIADADD